jgi:hypothetical protein
VEDGVSEEVADLVDEVPVPFAESHQDLVVAALEDVQMGLGVASASEKSLQENLVFSLRVDRTDNTTCFGLCLEQGLKVLENLEVSSWGILLVAGCRTTRLIGLQKGRTDELVIKQSYLFKNELEEHFALDKILLFCQKTTPLELFLPVAEQETEQSGKGEQKGEFELLSSVE